MEMTQEELEKYAEWRKRPFCPCTGPYTTEFPKVVYLQKRVRDKGHWDGPFKTRTVKTGDYYCEKCKCYYRMNEKGLLEKI
jgi:hypothetical protein